MAITTIKDEICSQAAGLTAPSPSSVAQGFPSLLGTCEPCTREYPPPKRPHGSSSPSPPPAPLLCTWDSSGTCCSHGLLGIGAELELQEGDVAAQEPLRPMLWHDIRSSRHKGAWARSLLLGSPGIVCSASRRGRHDPCAAAWPSRSFPGTLPLVFMAPIKPKCALHFSFVYYKL